jgi:hypothetical protein
MSILAGSGHSSLHDAFLAGQAAATAAIAPLCKQAPRLSIAFTTDHYDQAQVLSGIRAVIGATPLIGCCTGGLITRQGAVSAGVAVLALYAEDLDATLMMAQGLHATPEAAAERVAEQLEAKIEPFQNGKHHLAFLLIDGLTGALSIDTALETTATILGPLCTVFGAAAGDSLKFGQTNLFSNNQISGDAISAALITTAAPLGVGVRHGWKPIGRPLAVTRSEANLIYEFEGKPALEVYRELFPGQEITAENFREITPFHPIGFYQANGEFMVRLPYQAYPDGSIACLGMLPPHSLAHIMYGTPESLIDAAQEAARHAVAQLEGHAIAAAIVINCVARPPLLGEQASTEIERICAVLGEDTPFIGMYSFGEIAADEGPVCYRNKTVAICAIGQF